MANEDHTSTADLSRDSKSLLDWVLTPVFLLVFLLVLCAFEVFFQFRRLLRAQRAYEPLFQGINQGVLSSLQLTGLSYEVKGSPQGLRLGHEAGGHLPVLLLSNHQSMFDIPFLARAFPKLPLRFVAKKQLAQYIPGISLALRNGEHALIDRKDPKQALPELERVSQLARYKGFAIVVFPEGTRSRDGSLKKFKSGGLDKIISSLGEALVVPVAIKGSWRLAQFSLWPVPSKQKVEVIVCDPIRVSSDFGGDRAAQLARDSIQKALQ